MTLDDSFDPESERWRRIGGWASETYETTDTEGVVWRLWLVKDPEGTDPFPAGYRLAPRDEPEDVHFITREHGSQYATVLAVAYIFGREHESSKGE